MIRKAFQVSALDYLVKPLDEVEVRQALLRSFRYLSKKRNRIALKISQEWRSFITRRLST